MKKLGITLNNLLHEMKKDVLDGRVGSTGSIQNSGFKRIPNASQFVIHVQPENELLKEVGMSRRLTPRMETKPNNNKKMNDYMDYQIKRLWGMLKRGEFKKYWVSSKYLVENSASFRTAAFIRVNPGWWHTMSISGVVALQKKIDSMIKSKDTNLNYRRVYIDKEGTDTYRPLGVPGEAWRVIMHMWSNFITMRYRSQLEKFNHGFMPGRGTMTAWKEVIRKVLPSKYIYEFDLKQFFPGVNPNMVERMLGEGGMPEELVAYFNNILRCFPHFPKEEKLDETLIKDKVMATYNGLLELGDIAHELAKSDGYHDLWEYAKAQAKKLEKLSPSLMGTSMGIPQGLNISPVLSIVTLIEWAEMLKERDIKLLMYADDGIMYGDKPFDPYFAPWLTESKEKSGWIKQVEWNKGLKFLGIFYDPWKDLIQGHTRKGSRLEFGPKQMGVFDLIKTLTGHHYPFRLRYLTESNIFGLIQSKLYNGTWAKVVTKESKPWITKLNSWWGHMTEMKGHKTLPSDAIATLLYISRSVIKGEKKLRLHRRMYRHKQA